MGKLFSTAIALLIAITIAGCSSGHKDIGPTTTVSGTVRIPNAVSVSMLRTLPIFAADIGGLTPAGAGVTVQLVQLSSVGSVVSVLATTTTDASGAYTFSGPTIPDPDATLEVRVVNGPATNMRALVSGNQVDITPASEAVFRKVIESGLGINLPNLTPQEVASLDYLLLGMGIDVSGQTFDNAVTTIDTAAGSILTNLVTTYAATGNVSNLQDYFYNTISTRVNLLDPYSLSGISAGGIALSTNYGGGTIDINNTMVKGSQEAIISPMLHDLSTVTQSGGDPNLDITDLEGVTYSLNTNSQVIAWDADGNGTLGIVNSDASLMVFPETSNTPISGGPYITLSRGIRIATAGNHTFAPTTSAPQIAFSNAFLDAGGTGGTAYHLIQLSQTLSSAASGSNAATIGTATGDLVFDSSNTLNITENNGQQLTYAGFAANTLNTDTLSLDIDSSAVTSGTGTSAIGGTSGGYYYVNTFSGNLTLRDNDGGTYAYLGLGTLTQTGEIFTLVQTPNDNGQQATLDATGTHSLAVAVRQTPAASSPVTLTPGTYNVVLYDYYLNGGSSASVESEYKYGTLTLGSDGTTVSGGSLISNRASLNIATAKLATSDALTSLPSTTPETTVSGSITPPAADGTTTLSLTIGSNTLTGTGAVTADGKLIITTVQIADTTPTDIGRGLLFLMRQAN